MAAVVFGLTVWPGGLAAVVVWGLASAGLVAHERIRSASGWLGSQAGVVAAFVGIAAWRVPVWSPPSDVAAVAVLMSGLIVAIEWGGVFVGRAIAPFTDGLYTPTDDDERVIHQRGLPKGFPEGGQTIGRWERLLIFLFVLADAPTAIGFLVTAKSILRFGEIKDRDSQKEAEYIIIGTLMSFGFALVVAYATRLALLTLLPQTSLASFIGG